jgi:hypothetical protein
MPVAVLRAVVSTPSVPVFVIRHEPRRQPSAEVVVVAGAVGAVPVGLTAGEVASVGVSDASLGVGDSLASVGESVGDVEVEAVTSGLEADGLRPIWPHTAPAMRPTTATTAIAIAIIAAEGELGEPPRRCATPSA